MKLSVVGLLVIGLIAALAAALLVGLVSVPQGGPRSQGPVEIQILVAARDLPAMSVIDAADVKSVSVPREKVPAKAATSPVEIIGKVLAVPLVADQPFVSGHFATEGGGPQLAAALATGKRAVAISLSDHAGLDGVLYPGSVVDVLCTLRSSNRATALSSTVLERVQVLAIERLSVVAKESAKGDEAAKQHGARRVTLLVTDKQAKILQLAMNAGTVSLAMRNPLDSRPADRLPVSLAEVLGAERRWGASLLSSLVSGLSKAAPQTAVASQASPATRPETAPAAKVEAPLEPTWQVRVVRGAAVEVQQFPVERDRAEAPGPRGSVD